MGDVAQFQSFGPFFRNGQLVSGPRLFHYLPGTSTLKDAWAEREKLTTAANPIVGDATGMVSAFFDGIYKLVVTMPDEQTVLKTWNNVSIVDGLRRLEGQAIWNPGSLADGAGETSPEITIDGAELGDFVLVAAPYDLQGLQATAYVSAADTVKIRLQNETGSVVDLASGTWSVRILQA